MDDVVRALTESVKDERWDDFERLTNGSYFALSLTYPEELRTAFEAVPEDWIQAHPRHMFVRSIMRANDSRFPTTNIADWATFTAWVEAQESPATRDVMAVLQGRLRHLLASGRFAEASAEADAVHDVVAGATDFADFDDVMPGTFVRVGVAKLLHGEIEPALRFFAEAQRWSLMGAGHPTEGHAANFMTVTSALGADVTQAKALITDWAGERLALEGSGHAYYEAAGFLARALLGLGTMDEPTARAAVGLLGEREDMGEFWWVGAHVRARIALYWGEREDAAAELARILMLRAALSGPASFAGRLLRSDLSDLYQSMGRLNEAERALDVPGLDVADPLMLGARARLAVLRGEPQAAVELLDRATVSSGAFGTPAQWHVIAANAAGTTGDDERVERELDRAAAAVRRRGSLEALVEVSPELRDRLFEHAGLTMPITRDVYQRREAVRLTRSELDVLRALGKHSSTKGIATELYVSVNTVKSHLRNLYRKLGVHSRDEALHATRYMR